jgi:hypothetical protein
LFILTRVYNCIVNRKCENEAAYSDRLVSGVTEFFLVGLYYLAVDLVSPASVILDSGDCFLDVNVLCTYKGLPYTEVNTTISFERYPDYAPLSRASRAESSSQFASMAAASLYKSSPRRAPGALRPHVVSRATWAAATAVSTSLAVASDTLVIGFPFAERRAFLRNLLK